LASESELVERARLGDRAAAGLLVRRYEGTAYAVALARLRDVHEARDVAQDTLVRALSSLPKLREASRFGAYVARIAWRLAIDRKRAARPAAPLSDGAAGAGPGPLDRLTAEERRVRLLEELGRLPEQWRQVFLLHHLDGATYARIAGTLGVKEGTVGWILHRARRSLRTSLSDLIEDER